MYRACFVAGTACLLVGCATVGPDYAAPNVFLASNYAAAASKGMAIGPETRWWEGLSDPTLNRLIEAAQISNVTVAQAVERVREARASAKAISANGLPELDASGLSEATDGGSTSASAIGELAAVWEIDLFGKYRRNRESARATQEAAQEDLNVARLTLLGDVATAYVEARGHESRLAVARRTLAAQRESLAITQAQLAAGSATALDVSRAEGDAASTEADIPSIEVLLPRLCEPASDSA